MKLLDFGIAKLLDTSGDSSAALTRDTVRAMMPDYASPEQIRGGAITTASDVYQLGLLMFEVLSGRRAQTTSGLSPAETERLICERDHGLPSASAAPAIALRLRGDLDTIVAKALAKEPESRYRSVQQLIDDLLAYRAGHPIAARKPSIAYRAGKVVRRHRLAVAAAALVVAVAAAGTIATLIQARSATREGRRATQIRDFLVGVFQIAAPDESRGQAATHCRRVTDGQG